MKKLLALLFTAILVLALVPKDTSAAMKYETRQDTVTLNSYNFAVEKSSTYNITKGSFRVQMPNPGTYSFTHAKPEIRVKLVRNLTGKTVSSKTFKGVTQMKAATFYLEAPIAGKYHVEIQANISAPTKVWKYSATFR